MSKSVFYSSQFTDPGEREGLAALLGKSEIGTRYRAHPTVGTSSY